MDELNMNKQLITTEMMRLIEERVGTLEDCRFYFDNIAWCFSSTHKERPRVMEDILATDYIQYGNNETITVAFDGNPIYTELNDPYIGKNILDGQLREMLWEHGYYMERGNAWNFTLFKV